MNPLDPAKAQQQPQLLTNFDSVDKHLAIRSSDTICIKSIDPDSNGARHSGDGANQVVRRQPGYENFEAASSDVLAYLHQKLGFSLWMVTRVVSNQWIVLYAQDHGYNVQSGDVFKWSDSFCSRMVEGLGPNIAPNASQVPAYAAAPIYKDLDIGAYIGIPLWGQDDCLIGTLCAIDPSPMDKQIESELPLVEMMARMLTTLLENEKAVGDEQRRTEHALAKAMSDHMTGLYNRRGWETLLAQEEARCRPHGLPAGLFSIDIDNLKITNDKFGHQRGDELICKAAATIKKVTRPTDVVARLGGDEFAVLATGCSAFHVEALHDQLKSDLEKNHIHASIGSALLSPGGSLIETFAKADKNMYQSKISQKTARSAMPKSNVF